MIREFDGLMDLMETFADEQTAIDHLTAIRWRNGAFCPYCRGDAHLPFQRQADTQVW
jgi:hypothetical protein